MLARLLVPFAGPHEDSGCGVEGLADDLLLATLGRLVALGARLGEPGPVERLALAVAGAHSHAGWVHLGRSPFASPVWYLATEVSAAFGLRKAPATALVLPAWASAVLTGERAWGDRSRLLRAWGAVRAAAAQALALPSDPVEGLRALGARWAPADPAARIGFAAAEIADRCARRWGAGLPMLGSLDARALTAVIEDALAGGSPALERAA